MFLKLHFNNGIRINEACWIADHFINNRGSANLTNWMTGSVANSNFSYAGYSAKNSIFVNTNNPTTVRSSWGPWRGSGGVNYVGCGRWVLEFSMHDDASQKYYIQYENSNNNNETTYRSQWYGRIGTEVTSYPNTQWATTSINLDKNTITHSSVNYIPRIGMNTGVTGADHTNGTSKNQVLGPYTQQYSNTDINTFWMYLTDDCFTWAVTRGYNTVNGFPPHTSIGYQYYNGPYVFSQYTRDDAFNYSNNDNLYSVAYYNWNNAQSGAAAANGYAGFLHSGGQLGSVNNNVAKGSTYDYSPMIMLSTKDMSFYPSANSIPANNTLIHARASINFGNFYSNDGVGMADAPSYTGNNGGTTGTSANRRSWLSSTSTYASTYRLPSADLTGLGYRLTPFGVYSAFNWVNGGSITERSGLKIYNGNYVPGDTITQDGTTYVLWPTYYSSPTVLIALAVPKE